MKSALNGLSPPIVLLCWDMRLRALSRTVRLTSSFSRCVTYLKQERFYRLRSAAVKSSAFPSAVIRIDDLRYRCVRSAKYVVSLEFSVIYLAFLYSTAYITGMDKIDRKIISLLAQDARRSLSDIGSAVELSASAVNERIRRLTASGAIRRTTVDADPQALDVSILAFIWIALAPGADEASFRTYAAGQPCIAECHHVTGAWSYLMKIHTGSLAGIEAFLTEMKRHGFLARSETVIALSSVVDGPFILKEGMV
ncbi:Lrp/AsnC family transcriptional regulator [Agrobacterium tumefaciens]|nr:Lrp/AsnC family transcriptional regulator [Agrobacterium tumefaciens]